MPSDDADVLFPNVLQYYRGEKGLLALDFDDASRRWRARPFSPFSPRGLMIWGAPPMTQVRNVVIAGCSMFGTHDHGIPAAWFAIAQNLQQLQKMLAASHDPPEWLEWPTLDTVTGIELELFNPNPAFTFSDVEMVLWGETLRR